MTSLENTVGELCAAQDREDSRPAALQRAEAALQASLANEERLQNLVDTAAVLLRDAKQLLSLAGERERVLTGELEELRGLIDAKLAWHSPPRAA
ncbi:hypothetical protein JNW90_21015 [Micromonospora sp. STR1s_5]|nr:hypothetical protein [Micromonospora sp. STR1s_5]